VVRISNCTPKRPSSNAKRLLTAGFEIPISRAVAEKLPVLANKLKNAISEGADTGVDMG
jgi:hypothetical protein